MAARRRQVLHHTPAAEFPNRDPKGPVLFWSCAKSHFPRRRRFLPLHANSLVVAMSLSSALKGDSPHQVRSLVCLCPIPLVAIPYARKKKKHEKIREKTRADKRLPLQVVILTVKPCSTASSFDKANNSHRTISGNMPRGGHEMHFAKIKRSRIPGRSRSWCRRA